MGIRGGGIRRPWREKTVGALTAGCFLVYLIALSPHLVHHLFDEDHDSPSCPFLALSQHTPELRTDPPTISCLIWTGHQEDSEPMVPLPSPLMHNRHLRGPPSSVPLS